MKTLIDLYNRIPLILIVDDIPANLKVIGSILMTEKYNVLPATNGDLAIEFAKTQKPDLILLDVQMPDKDGFEVCKILKQDIQTKYIPIIFLTAKNETDNIVHGFEVGGDDYITKPFDSKEMLARVKTHLKLEFTTKRLIELIATKDKFFSIITHDLKGPFAAMVRISGSLYKSITDKKTEEIIETSKMLNEAIKDAFDLLENLLQWSRTQTGRIENLPINQNLHDIVNENINITKSLSISKKIKIENKISEKTEVYADINLLKTILRNLISNAIKYTKTGGSIKIKSEDKGNMTEISVIDNGIGMSEKIQEKIFTIDPSCMILGTDNERGTGLGLIICKEFVEKMGGKIWAKSEEGKGSQFVFSLPQGK